MEAKGGQQANVLSVAFSFTLEAAVQLLTLVTGVFVSVMLQNEYECKFLTSSFL